MTGSVSGSAAAASSSLAGAVGNTAQTCPRVVLELGFFFDGTLNNAANSRTGGSEGSYANALSNVALLFDLYKRRERFWQRNSCGGYARKYDAFYVPGPGTTSGGGDDWFLGNGLGIGSNGVLARVTMAFRQLDTMIAQHGGGTDPREVVVDVFGFSRGAAGARYFVNCVRQGHVPMGRHALRLRYLTRSPNNRVRFRFVGIFDTVAAIGIGTNDDNGIVNVHVSAAQAEKIFHLTAGDEYRENFRLNHNLPGGGEARELPGAHSDVGGGYREQGDEVDIGPARVRTFATRAEAERQRAALAAQRGGAASEIWVREGWINANEPTGGAINHVGPIQVRTSFSPLGNVSLRYEFTVVRRLSRPWVRVGLSRIALRIMYDKAVESSVPFVSFPTGPNYTVPGPLLPIAAKLRSGQSLTREEHRFTLRNYGHVSADVGSIGMSPEPNHVRTVYPNRPGQAR